MVFIIAVITFALGFLLGLMVGVKKAPKIEFTPAPEPVISEEVSAPKEVIPEKELPWNLTLVNFENELSADFEPAELAEADNGYVVDARIADAAKTVASDREIKLKRAFGLSEREVEIALMMYEGFTNRQISSALKLGEGTTRNYISTVYVKTNTGSRNEAVKAMREVLS